MPVDENFTDDYVLYGSPTTTFLSSSSSSTLSTVVLNPSTFAALPGGLTTTTYSTIDPLSFSEIVWIVGNNHYDREVKNTLYTSKLYWTDERLQQACMNTSCPFIIRNDTEDDNNLALIMGPTKQRTPLMYQAYRGNLQRFQYLAKLGASILRCSPVTGWGPLHFAAAEGHDDIVRFCFQFYRPTILQSAILMTTKTSFVFPATGERTTFLPYECALYGGYDQCARLLLQNIPDSHFTFLQSPSFTTSNENNVVRTGCVCLCPETVLVLVQKSGWNPLKTIDKDQYTLLHYACQFNLLPLVRYLIAHDGAPLMALNHLSHTPLHTACTNYAEEVILYLCDYCLPLLNKKSEVGDTPVMIAAVRGLLNATIKLIELGSDVRIRTRSRDTLLTLISWQNKMFPVADILFRKGVDINAVNQHSDTALTLACRFKNIPLAIQLIEYGADVHSKNTIGDTALTLCAARIGTDTVLRKLMDAKADINHRTNADDDSLNLACAKNNSSAALLLMNAGANVNSRTKSGDVPLSLASWQGMEEVVDRLLANPTIELNIQNQYEDSALTLACRFSNTSIAIKLIKKGASVHQRNNVGETPISLCAARGLDNVVRLLIEKKANLETKTRIGDFPLALSCSKAMISTSLLLIEAGASVHTRTKTEDTPLTLVAWQGIYDLVDKLISKGADVNDVNKHNDCALTLCCRFGHSKVAHRLLDAGSKVTTVNVAGCTALSYSCEQGLEDVVKRILAISVENINAVTSNGNPPLLLAIKHGYIGIAKLLIEYGADINYRNGEVTAKSLAEEADLDDLLPLLEQSHNRKRRKTDK